MLLSYLRLLHMACLVLASHLFYSPFLFQIKFLQSCFFVLTRFFRFNFSRSSVDLSNLSNLKTDALRRKLLKKSVNESLLCLLFSFERIGFVSVKIRFTTTRNHNWAVTIRVAYAEYVLKRHKLKFMHRCAIDFVFHVRCFLFFLASVLPNLNLVSKADCQQPSVRPITWSDGCWCEVVIKTFKWMADVPDFKTWVFASRRHIKAISRDWQARYRSRSMRKQFDNWCTAHIWGPHRDFTRWMTKCHNSIHSVMLHSCWLTTLGPGFRDNLAHGNVKVP